MRYIPNIATANIRKLAARIRPTRLAKGPSVPSVEKNNATNESRKKEIVQLIMVTCV